MPLNPHPIPSGKHRFVQYLVRPAGLAFDEDVIDLLADHIDKVGFVHLGEDHTSHEVRFVIGLPADQDTDIVAAPGEHLVWVVPEGWRSHCRVVGSLPPGVGLVGDVVSGVCPTPGVWPVTVIVGPALKFDALGHGGAPHEPGAWVPVENELTPPAREAGGVDLSVLSTEELDDVIAQATAAKRDREMVEMQQTEEEDPYER